MLKRLSSSHLPEPPANPTNLHHDLPSFLAHASRSSLAPTTTTYIGTYYEYLVADTLRRHGLTLSRTGGRGDSGIDLLGTWQLPEALSRHPLRVLVQCKALKTKLGPNLIRELEGAFVGAPSGWRGKGVLGILVSTREATKGVRDAMGKSTWPMAWVMLEVVKEGEMDGGKLRQVLWNKVASEMGLEGMDVTVKYGDRAEGEEVGKEVLLMCQGRPLIGVDEQERTRTHV